MTATMTAAVIREHGGPECMTVESTGRPVPGPGEICVKVGACGVSHLDIFVRRGMPGVEIPLPHIAGGDVTGWVEELGPDVDSIEAGTPVLIDPTIPEGTLGEGRAGGLAEYVVVPAGNAIPLPGDDTGLLVAVAALPIAYGTAQRMIFDRGGLKAGETVAVLGASGGVGVACAAGQTDRGEGDRDHQLRSQSRAAHRPRCRHRRDP
ncbi:MAG: alcohol dehydrogenase catalytic domain-containing protein [Solirubrobacterales bacterium]|nr:alcohol dehydrogenase catalytic domain-containing protein [Solirubrobacterales bacterium]